jgi:hypothetical protein
MEFAVILFEKYRRIMPLSGSKTAIAKLYPLASTQCGFARLKSSDFSSNENSSAYRAHETIALSVFLISASSAIIDGEVVVPAADGTTDYSVPQNELKGKSDKIAIDQRNGREQRSARDAQVLDAQPVGDILRTPRERGDRRSTRRPSRWLFRLRTHSKSQDCREPVSGRHDHGDRHGADRGDPVRRARRWPIEAIMSPGGRHPGPVDRRLCHCSPIVHRH